MFKDIFYVELAENFFLLAKLSKIFYFDFEFKSLAVIILHCVSPIENIGLTNAVFTMVCIAHQGYTMKLDIEKNERTSGSPKLRQKRNMKYI